MKIESVRYECDRCGAELPESYILRERLSLFCKQEIRNISICFWKNRDIFDAQACTYELCDKCRESLERWLNNENA